MIVEPNWPDRDSSERRSRSNHSNIINDTDTDTDTDSPGCTARFFDVFTWPCISYTSTFLALSKGEVERTATTWDPDGETEAAWTSDVHARCSCRCRCRTPAGCVGKLRCRTAVTATRCNSLQTRCPSAVQPRKKLDFLQKTLKSKIKIDPHPRAHRTIGPRRRRPPSF
jgi:hypothetical protein